MELVPYLTTASRKVRVYRAQHPPSGYSSWCAMVQRGHKEANVEVGGRDPDYLDVLFRKAHKILI